jgi:hypothetical protein
MHPEDIPECVGIIANHPVIGPRYGSTIGSLPEAWFHLLQSEAKVAVVVQAGESPRAPICLAVVTAIVQDDFLLEMKTPPHFWVGPELTRRIATGQSPLLTGKQLRDANSRHGLNLVCWEGCIHQENETDVKVHRYMMASFIQEHRGYLWKEVISAQSWTVEHLDFIFRTGGRLWDPLAGGYTAIFRGDAGQIVSKPHLMGITRELELQKRHGWEGSWIGAMFDYHVPILGFSSSEQRLLTSALSGETDEQLAGTLGTSLATVKKIWVSIYNRIEDGQPGLIPERLLQTDTSAGIRGKEKRRGLLSYLRDHPEELRPYSRKLLSDTARLKPRSSQAAARV